MYQLRCDWSLDESRSDLVIAAGCGVDTTVSVRRRSGYRPPTCQATAPPPVVADEVELVAAHVVGNGEHVGDEARHGVGGDVGGPGAWRVTPLVGSDRPVAGVGQRGQLRPPGIRGLGETMEEDDEPAA